LRHQPGSSWEASSTLRICNRARDLCAETGDDRLLHPVLAGLFVFHVSKNAELGTAEKLGLELLSLGEAKNDRVLQVDGHTALANAYYSQRGRGTRSFVKERRPAALGRNLIWQELFAGSTAAQSSLAHAFAERLAAAIEVTIRTTVQPSTLSVKGGNPGASRFLARIRTPVICMSRKSKKDFR
jgi:hypothetical protein